MFEQLFYPYDLISGLLIALLIIYLGYRPPWLNKLKKGRSNVHDIPGPLSLPLLGTKWVFTFGGYRLNKLHEFYEDMNKKFGPIVKEEALFNVPVINVFEKDDIEKVWKSSGKYPIRPPTEAIAHYRKSRPERYASTGIVNEQGEMWHFLRSTLTADLTSPRTISSFLPQVEEIADDWCNLLNRLQDNLGYITNFEYAAECLGLETTCALVLGRRMGFLLSDTESKMTQQLAAAVREHFKSSRDTYFGLPIWKILPTAAYNRLAESEEIIYKLALELIETADEATKESAIFQAVLNANIDDREKTAAIVDFIAAGIHTLKNSLIFVLYHVSKPEIQRKIIEDDPITNSFLKACINETFRVLPTANCLARVTETDLELSGYHVDAGSVVVCHTGIACKDERNFAQAREFKPERWLNERKSETISNATYLVTPFGIGRRICPGKRFIEQSLPIIVKHTILKYNIVINQPLELQFEFLLSPKGPISIKFEER